MLHPNPDILPSSPGLGPGHVVVPHDCVIARPVRLDALAMAMYVRPEHFSYVKLLGRSTLHYAEQVGSV